MRIFTMTRVAATAVVVALVATLALVSPASAKPSRHISIFGKKTGRVTFTLHGKVSPAFHHKRVFLKYASKPKGHYSTVRSDKTDGHGKYSIPHVSKPGYYAVVTKAGNKYKASASKVVRIYRI